MNRKEAYYNIKQFGYGPELQKKFGKPYSSVSSDELIPAVEEMMKAGKPKNESPKKESTNQGKKEVQEKDKKEVPKLSFGERISLGRQYIDKINLLKARKAYMEKSLEIITKREDLSIRISSAGGMGYYEITPNGGLESHYYNKEYPDFLKSMYYFTKERLCGSLGVFPLSYFISDENNIQLIKKEYISLYKEFISDINEQIKKFEIKFAEL